MAPRDPGWWRRIARHRTRTTPTVTPSHVRIITPDTPPAPDAIRGEACAICGDPVHDGDAACTICRALGEPT